jgi:ferredoxin, 2Fe-2S
LVTLLITDRDGKAHAIDTRPGRSLMQTLCEAGLPIAAVCGGNGICSTCHILVGSQWVASLALATEEEIELLTDESPHFDSRRSRLSCQIPTDILPDGFQATLAPQA